jgi:predicted PurR-regulated permease PerM
LFVGPVLLAVSYVLLLEWLQQNPLEIRRRGDKPAS